MTVLSYDEMRVADPKVGDVVEAINEDGSLDPKLGPHPWKIVEIKPGIKHPFFLDNGHGRKAKFDVLFGFRRTDRPFVEDHVTPINVGTLVTVKPQARLRGVKPGDLLVVVKRKTGDVLVSVALTDGSGKYWPNIHPVVLQPVSVRIAD